MSHRSNFDVIHGAIAGPFLSLAVLAAGSATAAAAPSAGTLNALKGLRLVVATDQDTFTGVLYRYNAASVTIRSDGGGEVQIKRALIAYVGLASYNRPASNRPKPRAHRLKALRLMAKGKSMRTGGIVVTSMGLGLAVLGAGLAIAADASLRNQSETYSVDKSPGPALGLVFGAGISMLVGVVMTFVGGVVWADGNSRRTIASRMLARGRSDTVVTDPTHERRLAATLGVGHPRAQVFRWQLHF